MSGVQNPEEEILFIPEGSVAGGNSRTNYDSKNDKEAEVPQYNLQGN